MSYRIERIPASAYVHIVLTGRETLENLQAAWTEISEMSRASAQPKILCEAYLEFSATTTDLYEFGEGFSRFEFPESVRIAVVCSEAALPNVQFVDNVIYNRGGDFVRVFTEIDPAIAWLTDS